MKDSGVITLSLACEYFRVDPGLVRDFADFGLIPVEVIHDEDVIEASNLDRLRKIISLHESLGINKEGIEVILGLRERISGLEEEVGALREEVARLKRFREAEEPETLRRCGLLIEISE
jgi:hypothetical protein